MAGLTPSFLDNLARGRARLPPVLAAAVSENERKMHRSPEQPDAYLGRWGSANLINVFTLRPGSWFRYDTDRPVIIRISTSTPLTAEATLSEFPGVLYAPNRVPTLVTDVQQSRAGVVYLSNPGAWWMVQPIIDGRAVTCLVFDASDPIIAAFYLSLPGSVAQAVLDFDIPGPTAGILVSADSNRVGFVLQNVSASIDARWSVGQSTGNNPVGGATPDIQRGLRLRFGSEAVCVGDILSRGRIMLVRQDAAVNDPVHRYILQRFTLAG